MIASQRPCCGARCVLAGSGPVHHPPLSQSSPNPTGPRCAAGALMTPAVLYPVTRGMRLFSEEQFGPLVPIATYSADSELVDYLRTTPYGQQATQVFPNPRPNAPQSHSGHHFTPSRRASCRTPQGIHPPTPSHSQSAAFPDPPPPTDAQAPPRHRPLQEWLPSFPHQRS